MIEYSKGNLFTDDAESLVNTVKFVGVMGRGVALQFKGTFPENFQAYAAACKRGEVRPGRRFVFETRQLTSPLFTINFPTKRHWRARSRLEDIEVGLEDLVCQIGRLWIRSVVLPFDPRGKPEVARRRRRSQAARMTSGRATSSPS